MSAYYIGTPCARAGHTKRYSSSGACAECSRTDTARWRVENPERVRIQKLRVDKGKARQRTALWRARNPERAAKAQAVHYGRCPLADAAARAEHDGHCAICSTTAPGGKGWQVDHVHDGSGDIRGVLCFRCNIGIGNLQDNPAFLRKAADYVARTPKYQSQS